MGLDLHACGRTNVRPQPPAVPGSGAADGLEPAFSDTQPPAVPGSGAAGGGGASSSGDTTMLLAVPGSRAVVLVLLLIDLCDRTTIFQSQPRLPKPNQRLPLLKTATSTETSTETSISTESSTKTFTSIETSTKTSTTSATAILWLRACSGHSLSLSLLFLCDHTTGSLSAHLTGSGLWSHLPLSDGKT